MASNLADLDLDLLERALAVRGERTKPAPVPRALQEFVARREQARIVDPFGMLEWNQQYHYKVARSRP